MDVFIFTKVLTFNYSVLRQSLPILLPILAKPVITDFVHLKTRYTKTQILLAIHIFLLLRHDFLIRSIRIPSPLPYLNIHNTRLLVVSCQIFQLNTLHFLPINPYRSHPIILRHKLFQIQQRLILRLFQLLIETNFPFPARRFCNRFQHSTVFSPHHVCNEVNRCVTEIEEAMYTQTKNSRLIEFSV